MVDFDRRTSKLKQLAVIDMSLNSMLSYVIHLKVDLDRLIQPAIFDTIGLPWLLLVLLSYSILYCGLCQCLLPRLEGCLTTPFASCHWKIGLNFLYYTEFIIDILFWASVFDSCKIMQSANNTATQGLPKCMARRTSKMWLEAWQTMQSSFLSFFFSFFFPFEQTSSCWA